MNATAAAMVGVAYLLGSVSFAVLIVRLTTGKDIRTEGSGNAGATNVLRAHGRRLGLTVALLDIAKGAGAVLLVRAVTGKGAAAVTGDDGSVEVRGMSTEQVGDLAFAEGIRLHELATVRASLEEAFMELTADSVEYHAGVPDAPASIGSGV